MILMQHVGVACRLRMRLAIKHPLVIHAYEVNSPNQLPLVGGCWKQNLTEID